METLTLSLSLTREIQAEARAARKSVEELLAEALQQYRLEAQRQKISQEAEWWDHVSLETRKNTRGNMSPFISKRWLTKIKIGLRCMIVSGQNLAMLLF